MFAVESYSWIWLQITYWCLKWMSLFNEHNDWMLWYAWWNESCYHVHKCVKDSSIRFNLSPCENGCSFSSLKNKTIWNKCILVNLLWRMISLQEIRGQAHTHTTEYTRWSYSFAQTCTLILWGSQPINMRKDTWITRQVRQPLFTLCNHLIPMNRPFHYSNICCKYW